EALRRAESAGCDLSAVARLQAAQLDNSRETFERSVREIRGALDRIEQDVEEVATEAARLLGLSGAGQASFFSGVQTDLLGILTILESNAAAASGLAEAAVSVHQRVDAITGTAAGVRAIGLAMQRIALNAAIQAARLGQDGAALEIVAQSIQGLARETETASATLENRVLAIREAAGVLSGAEADCRGSDEQVARLGGAAGALHSIQQEAHRGCARAGELAGRLKERVRETSAAFAAGGDCLPLLGAAAEELRGLSPGASSPLAAEVEHMKSIYTMQSERGVHESLCKTVSGEPVDTEEDNVEFF
ncbi:MAG TPA: hypothetical protein VGS58_02445, partial [Candidatus Sulfopaludibacter sp.]|nr:hypothetical protein [Candidatus Sulfopaludibacter sp.]